MDDAFTLIPATMATPVLLVCDHASNAVPPAYGSLGLAAGLFDSHIAYDIGAAEVTRTLAAAWGCAALLGGWSRLLIDLNRGADDPTLVTKISDGSLVPGNRNADAKEVAARIARYHTPYHVAISAELKRIQASLPCARDSAQAGEVVVAGRALAPVASEDRRGPIIISIHSFTPAWKGKPRPWQLGVLYGRDNRLARPLMRVFEQAGFVVGDNEPYHGALEGDTLDTHGTKLGHANVLVEIRQDLVADAAMARAYAARLKPLLDAALAGMGQSAHSRETAK